MVINMKNKKDIAVASMLYTMANEECSKIVESEIDEGRAGESIDDLIELIDTVEILLDKIEVASISRSHNRLYTLSAFSRIRCIFSDRHSQ